MESKISSEKFLSKTLGGDLMDEENNPVPAVTMTSDALMASGCAAPDPAAKTPDPAVTAPDPEAESTMTPAAAYYDPAEKMSKNW